MANMGVSGFLKEVISLKKIDISQAERIVPLTQIRQEAEDTLKGNAALYREPYLFLNSIKRARAGKVGIIAEIKKASPSKGDIKPDLDPAKYADEYTKAGASAISVLTESHYFKGSIDDLKAVRATTHLPVLRKDFTLSSYQIYEAKAAGADSILLIVAMLSKEQLKDYVALVRELKMEPLVEINSEWQLDKALFSDAKIVGINNRNLETLEVDLNVSKRVVPFFTEGQIPVEASGISSSDDIKKGLESNIFNFLVGESIVRAENTKEFIQSLINTDIDNIANNNSMLDNYFNSNEIFIKICGLTSTKEALSCVEAGANAIGFIFYPKSPRYIEPEKVAEITKKLPNNIVTTGVFVDEDYDSVIRIAKLCSLKAVQLHGNESPSLVGQLKKDGLIVIKSLFAAKEPHLSKSDIYSDADAILVEYGKGELPGGNGESWNWQLAAEAIIAKGSDKKDAYISNRLKIVLAGGLNPDNIKKAIKDANPWGVDVSSGVELSPGKKDIGRVKMLIKEIKYK
ncbi:MAG: bifunctional indole-3-glycerol-phosphate synthase TrpC/phosphoribosylanthranilate isomerase TrpF [Desulfamplus sp.]|nr:bifunctional indole-3-glycerol-phosphate synthase TrpC/phosphoribosylanthranilate isomerase TrpF [Desulfamplus sp.]